jgi:CRP-like cAMP-binding protein
MFLTDTYLSRENLFEWSADLGIDLKTKSAKKGEIFLSQDQRCYYLYFITKGLIRLHYQNIDGQDVTHWFSSENMIITSPFSYFKNETNILNFEALEDSEFILITKENLDTLRENNKEANKAFQELFTEFAMNLSRRVMDIHTQTAEYRYLKLLERHPLIFQKAKLGHIASYLGITQQSLSRIRKNLIH